MGDAFGLFCDLFESIWVSMLSLLLWCFRAMHFQKQNSRRKHIWPYICIYISLSLSIYIDLCSIYYSSGKTCNRSPMLSCQPSFKSEGSRMNMVRMRSVFQDTHSLRVACVRLNVHTCRPDMLGDICSLAQKTNIYIYIYIHM